MASTRKNSATVITYGGTVKEASDAATVRRALHVKACCGWATKSGSACSYGSGCCCGWVCSYGWATKSGSACSYGSGCCCGWVCSYGWATKSGSACSYGS
ncbi:MAG: hypothetical protein WBA12_14260, partial [Catalinimonas sp.]